MSFNTTSHKHNPGIQLIPSSTYSGDHVLQATTLVGEDKVAMEYEYDHDVIVRHTRQTEKGIITQKKKLSVAMVFQGNPIWLLALEPNYVEKIFMVDFSSFSQLAKYLTDKDLDFTLYNSLVSYLGRTSFIFKPPPKDIIHLISGDVNFLNDKASKLRIKISFTAQMFIANTAEHYQPRPLVLNG